MPAAKNTATRRKTPSQTAALGAAEAVARLIAGPDGTIHYANDAFEAISGIRNVAGKSLFDILTFTNSDEAIGGGSALFGNKSPAGAAEVLRAGLHTVSFNKGHKKAALQFDWIDAADGRRFLVASAEEDNGFAQDILDFVPAPAAPAAQPDTQQIAADNELHHFIDMSPDVMSVAHADGNFVRVNGTFTTLLGYNETDVQGRNFADFIYPEDRAPVLAALQGLYFADDVPADGLMIDFEARVITADKKTLWMDWRHKRIDDHIYSVGRDITAIKRHEQVLRRHERQLSEAEAIGKMGRWRWKVGNDEIFWSSEIYRIFGASPADFTPTLDNVNSKLHRRDVGRLIQAFQRAIIEQNDYDMDFRVIRPDGETRFVRCEGRCEMDNEGDVIALYGIMQDITETVLHERDLRDAKESAERAYAAKSQFLANMSHELRTPLNAIIGFSEMMQRQLLGPIGTEKYLEYIGGIRESGEHLLDLISDILSMSKIEAGKYELDLEEINIAKTVKLAIHMMEGRALDSSIKISATFDNEDRMIVADRRAVMQILLNLLSNAVKFSNQGGTVHVECLDRADYLSIKVHDKGIGIPANKLKNIGKPFEQAASHYTRNHEGSGLGLAITKELAELHGGQMHIESTLGVGTSVTIRMPYDATATRRDRIAQEDNVRALNALSA
jgi:two-component system cell cycle sensor histidine kinase PleC